MAYKYSLITLIIANLWSAMLYGASQTISQSGAYKLGGNITYSPGSSDDIIRISASNVILDLGNYIITQGNLTSNVNGIQVSANLSNITIQNGTIRNLTGKGILVNQNCTNVTISNVLTFSCDARGIDFLGAGSPNQIRNAVITNSTIEQCCQGASGDFALSFSQAVYSEIIGVRLLNNGNSQHSLHAINLINCAQCTFSDIDVNSTVASTTCRGFFLYGVTDSNFNYCKLQDNAALSTNSYCAGFELFTSSGTNHNNFSYCSVLTLSAVSTGSFARGFSILDANTDNQFINCKVLLPTGNNLTYGYYLLNNSGNNFFSCLADRCNSISSSASGFEINTVSSSLFNNCVAINTLANTNAPGFNMTSCTDCVFYSCLAADNKVGNGFANTSGNQLSFNNCYSARNNNGFLLSSDTSSAYISNVALRNNTQYSGFGVSQNNTLAYTSVDSITQPWTNAGLS